MIDVPVCHQSSCTYVNIVKPSMGSKRKYDDGLLVSSPLSSWWTTLKDDMIVHGGFLHDSLGFCPETRELKLMNGDSSSSSSSEHQIATAYSNGGVGTTSSDNFSLVMRIPRSSMITQGLALRLISPWWPDVENTLQSLRDSGKLYSSVCDLLLAMGLAFVASSPPPPPSSSSSLLRDDRLARAYLATLPDSSSYWDGLPRRWSEDRLQDLLQGSPLLNRARQARKGIESDFALLQELFVSNDDGGGNGSSTFPMPFEKFSDMVAAVSSRAFAIVDDSDSAATKQDQEVALIPILDLCDHFRGGQAGPKKKNISYTFLDGSMVVRSVAAADAFTRKACTSLPLPAGETLRITYGAQGNPQLLFNYGFAIRDNLEPDGSSNDILEFVFVNDDKGSSQSVASVITNLRTGPKSDTYGCLVNALELFPPPGELSLNEDEQSEEGEQDDMEAFLAGDDEDDDDDIDLYGKAETPTDDCHEMDAKQETEHDLAALSKFKQAIEEKLMGYKLDGSTLSKRMAEGVPGPEHYSALVLHSEMRTLHFFLTAARKIYNLLEAKPTNQPAKNEFSRYDANDVDLMELQTDELATAFMTIRYSDEYLV